MCAVFFICAWRVRAVFFFLFERGGCVQFRFILFEPEVCMKFFYLSAVCAYSFVLFEREVCVYHTCLLTPTHPHAPTTHSTRDHLH